MASEQYLVSHITNGMMKNIIYITTIHPNAAIGHNNLLGLDTGKGTFIPLLVPLIRPNGRADFQRLEP